MHNAVFRNYNKSYLDESNIVFLFAPFKKRKENHQMLMAGPYEYDRRIGADVILTHKPPNTASQNFCRYQLSQHRQHDFSSEIVTISFDQKNTSLGFPKSASGR